jgi:hypothetical protein
MVSRKLLGLVMFAIVSCGMSFQSSAGEVVNGSFELGSYKDGGNGVYPTLSSSENYITGWTVKNFAYQFGSNSDFVTATNPNGYAFYDSDSNTVNISGPSKGDYFALLMSSDGNGGNLVSSISQTVKADQGEDIKFDMFLFTNNLDQYNIGNAIFTATLANGDKKYEKTFTSGDLPGFVVDPWTTITIAGVDAGTYTLTFSVQNTGSGNNINTYFGLDNVRVVPTPAAAYAGLALLGLFPLRRKLMGR